MKQRVRSAIIALIICIPIIIIGKVPFYLGASLIGLIGLYEMVKAPGKVRKYPNLIKAFAVILFCLFMLDDVGNKIFLSLMDKLLISIILLIIPIVFYNKDNKYDIEDEEILMSIRSHTTGRPGMSLLEKIVYIADYMEPGRKELPNMMDVRHLAFEDIDKCLYRILRDSLVYLKAQDMPIDQTTEETYQYYNELYSKH